MAAGGGQLQVLLDALKDGDDGARAELIEYAGERLRRLTKKMLRKYRRLERWEELDDVLQHALLRLHASLAEVRPDSAVQFFGLAATQIRRTLIDLARHHFGPEGLGAQNYTDIRHADGHNSVSEPATLQQWTEFYEALDGLPREEREVVDLLWFDGFSQVEAATLLKVSERTVRRRWYSARYLLYTALAAH
jgi:RNA polymerase sigma-70 factor (ECF subfamily)